MNTPNWLFVLLLLFVDSSILFAQANLLNAVIPQDVGKLNEQQRISVDHEALPYGYVDDRDIMWSKTIWEKIDLDERINYPFYYPVEAVDPNRKSLFDVLINDIFNGTITEVYTDGYFVEKETVENIKGTLKSRSMSSLGVDKSNSGDELDESETSEDYSTVLVEADGVSQYFIKGTWFFNKRLGELKYRLLGIAPVGTDASSKGQYLIDGTPEDQWEVNPFFWVWFPNARESLNKHDIFNSRNASQPITFDLMLNARRFNSIIYKEENPYNDREIKDYIYEDALRQLLESERIKNIIRDYEQDMWNN
tara:strand:- start:200 stop:1123 length:924 start_codon:yes stop_codon:yes gene_type:complete